MDIRADKQEVLRYLGYKKKQELQPDMNRQIDELIEEAVVMIKPRSVFQLFDISVDSKKEEVDVLGTPLVLKGKAITQHLSKASQVVLLAATLGIEIEKKIKIYTYTELTKGLILDSVGTSSIEQVCDRVECEAVQEIPATSFFNSRFSPGYGDLSLEVQSTLLKVLGAEKKIGLSCTPESIMIPRKSVTAIIGVFTEDSGKRRRKQNRAACSICNMNRSCSYRKEVEK